MYFAPFYYTNTVLKMKRKIPMGLIVFRLLLGPFMIFLAWNYEDAVRLLLVVLLFLGILSDIFDGIIARKMGVATVQLRRMDSQSDVVFWACTCYCTWLLNPDLIREHKMLLWIVFSMEALTYVFSYLKFRKENATHAILSKLWGITLLVAFVSMIGFGHAGLPFMLAVIVGIISHIDVYLIILLLPKWTVDVPSCYHAYLIRKGIPFRKHKLFNG